MEDAAAAASKAAIHASERSRVDDQQVQPGSDSRQEQGCHDDRISRGVDDLAVRIQDDALRAIASLFLAKDDARTQESVDDFISRLPDDVLGAIISLLPTKDGSRTQVLSRRWRPLWRSSAPLNLVVDSDLVKRGSRKCIAVISKILSDHPGPVRCFLLQDIFVPYSLGEIHGWLSSESLANVQELEVTYSKAYGGIWYMLSPFVLRFSSTLRVAKFGRCEFPDLSLPNFPYLKRLTLFKVVISEDSLHGLLSACTALENLSLHYPIGIGCFRISSRTLRSMDFYAPWNKEERIVTCQELVMEDVPCLERLIPLNPGYGPATIQVIQAPKLKILGLLSEDISILTIGTTIFQRMTAISLTTKMHTMKILVLESIGPNLDAVVDFLKCFPCLEKLYVISHPEKDMNNLRKYDPLDPIECLELYLKKVVLKNYDGNKRPAVDFAKFFVLNAKVLEEMEIGVLNRRNNRWMRNQRKRLRVENRASRAAQIELRRDAEQNFEHHVHTHDFSMDDPFYMPCGR